MAKYWVKVSEEIKAYIYVEVEAKDDDDALEQAREKAFANPLNCWSIIDEDGDMQYEKEQGCNNCGENQGPFFDVQWDGGDIEKYCKACYASEGRNN